MSREEEEKQTTTGVIIILLITLAVAIGGFISAAIWVWQYIRI